MSGELQVINYEEYAMTPERLVRQIELIQDVMKNVMHENEHYGKIPGCGDKPSLLKPGAEKLSTTFRLAPSYNIEEKNLPNNHREYKVVCTLTHIPTGAIFGQGVGAGSTMESKYRYRKSERICPKCGKDTIIKGKEEYGGGFICFAKKGGCGAKFKKDDTEITDQIVGRIEYEDPADYYNTVLKMAKKRAHVDAVLTCTAASDIFTQDVEDLPEHMRKRGEVIDVVPEQEKAAQNQSSQVTEGKTTDDLFNEAGKGDYTKMKAIDGYDKGMAIKCPDTKKLRPKSDCNQCNKSTDCSAWV